VARYRGVVTSPARRSLDGAVIAVIGITGGLGSAIARVLTERGAIVIGASRTADGSGADTVTMDLRDPDAGAALVTAAIESHGRLDGVINAAGIVAFGDLLDTDDVVIEEVFLTDVLGPLWLMKRVAPALADSKGFILNISAVVAETPMPSMAAYSAAKAALAAAAVSLRRELRRRAITVIDARPPHTETGLATRPIAGAAPRLAEGLDPMTVARRIIDGIEAGETEIASTQFT
jgi:cyclic-di-GMP-binding biofilm dispersal mediator protein